MVEQVKQLTHEQDEERKDAKFDDNCNNLKEMIKKRRRQLILSLLSK